MSKGKIIQVMGPVVDVAFEDENLPHIKDALIVDNQGKKCVMEVAQHVGGNVVRCIMLASSDGLCKDMEVEPTGAGIKVPVGKKTLGRLFNVLGETIDGGQNLDDEDKWVIHRDPPSFEDQSPVVEMLETGIKVIDLLAPYAKGGKIGLFGGIKNARFRHQVTPGDVLELECTILKQKGPVAVAEAKATVGGQLAVSAELTFALAKDL